MGGGEKAEGGTLAPSSARNASRANADIAPYLSPPGPPNALRANSSWSRRDAALKGIEESQMRVLDDSEYGGLETR